MVNLFGMSKHQGKAVNDSIIRAVTWQNDNMGAFKNYVDRRGWVGGQSNVYVSK